MVGVEVEFHLTAFGNPAGVFNGFRHGPEGFGHLPGAFEIELIGPELEPLGVVDGLSGLDAQQDIMGLDVVLVQVVAVVAGHQGNRQPAMPFCCSSRKNRPSPKIF